MYEKEYLKNKLNTVSGMIKTRYDFYENENHPFFISAAIPQNVMERYRSRLGWCKLAVDLLCDRLIIRRFTNDAYNMESIYKNNNADILYSSAIKGALISSCDFIYIYKDDNENVKMQVVGGGNATGILDDTTALLTEGYAVLKRDPKDNSVKLDAYFTEEYTEYTDYEQNRTWRAPHNAGRCLLVPIINDPKEGQKSFGHSRISKSMMDTQNDAERIKTMTKIIADINSWPQKWVTGLEEGTEIDAIKATFSSMLRFDKDSDGDRPTLGQFAQMSFSDHIKLFDQCVSEFSGLSSLTRDDLGFVTENPSSADSKKAALESLRVIAERCQKDMQTGFLNAGFVAACLRDDYAYSRTLIKDMGIKWNPLVKPDAATMSGIGDAVIKINQAVPGFFNSETLSDLIGIEGATVSNGLFDIERADFE